MNLGESEVLKFLDQLEFRNKPTDEELKDILKATQNVPLFLNMLKEILSADNDKKQSNASVIKKLKKEIEKFILEKAKNFFKNYYISFNDVERKEKFKEILFYLNNPEKVFNVNDIEEILDYQLMEIRYKEDAVSGGNVSETFRKNRDSNRTNEDPIIKDFFEYIEGKANPTKNSSDSITFSKDETNRIVTVYSRYPSIINCYKKIFDEYGENLVISGDLDLEIRDYINNYNYNTKSEFSFRNPNLDHFKLKGLLFEDIMNMYITNNKNESQFKYPAQLKFLKEWEICKYFDVLDFDKDLVKQKFEYLQNNHPNELFSQYPPCPLDLYSCYNKGLFFRNLTRNHPAIDGGFVSLELESQAGSSKLDTQSPRIMLTPQEMKNLDVNARLITYDITTRNDKFAGENIQQNISKYFANLKLITNMIRFKTIFKSISDVRLENHIFIILENEGISEINI